MNLGPQKTQKKLINLVGKKAQEHKDHGRERKRKQQQRHCLIDFGSC